MSDKVLRKVKVFIYQDEQTAKLYQCNLFEYLRGCPFTKARMQRGGSSGGFLKDSWVYDKYSKLSEYTTYKSVQIRSKDDVYKMTGLEATEIFYIDGHYQNDLLNAVQSHVKNSSGILTDINAVAVDGVTKELY